MRESTGYTVTLNIIIIFIVIIFFFLASVLVYFKSNKVSNSITDAIEKYEGYNTNAQDEITEKMVSLGYNRKKVKCGNNIIGAKNCTLVGNNGSEGYCVYFCDEGDYYYYKIKTNMMINIPIINDILNIPIYSNTNRMYDFEKNLS